jgi:hypothetical protein
MATHTPIPFWLSLPWREACAWGASVVEIQAVDRAQAGTG